MQISANPPPDEGVCKSLGGRGLIGVESPLRFSPTRFEPPLFVSSKTSRHLEQTRSMAR